VNIVRTSDGSRGSPYKGRAQVNSATYGHG